MISWVEMGWLPKKAETRGKAREVLLGHSMFNLEVFKMKDGVLMFTKKLHTSLTRGTWEDIEYLKGFFMMSARQKLRFLNGGCNTCLTKEWSMPVRTGDNVPSLTRFVGDKLYIDLVSMLDTVRGNQYLLTVEDSFSRYCREYPRY